MGGKPRQPRPLDPRLALLDVLRRTGAATVVAVAHVAGRDAWQVLRDLVELAAVGAVRRETSPRHTTLYRATGALPLVCGGCGRLVRRPSGVSRTVTVRLGGCESGCW